MATFLELKTDVNEIASRTVGDYVYKALTSELNARLRLVEMETTGTIALTSGTASYASDATALEYLHMNVLANSITTPVVLTTQFARIASLASSGRPTEAVVTDGLIEVNPTPDQSYTLGLRFIARLANLSADTDTNDVLDNYYNIYLYGALKHWTALTRDIERMQHWSGLFEEAITQAETSAARARYGAESLAIMPPARGAA